MSDRLDTEARKYVKARRRHERISAEAAKAKAELDAQVEAIYELMDDLNQPSAVLRLGEDIGDIRLTKPKPTIYGRIIDKDVAMRSLEDRGMTEEALDFEIRKAPVNEMIKECLERGEELPDGFDYSESHRLTLTYLDKKK